MLIRARELRNDPANWNRRIRKERAKEVFEWIRQKSGRYAVTIKVGEKMMDGATNFAALKQAYVRAGDNLNFFLKEEGSGKFISVPLYSTYLLFFTLVPLYPIFASRDELRKMTIPLLQSFDMSED